MSKTEIEVVPVEEPSFTPVKVKKPRAKRQPKAESINEPTPEPTTVVAEPPVAEPPAEEPPAEEPAPTEVEQEPEQKEQEGPFDLSSQANTQLTTEAAPTEAKKKRTVSKAPRRKATTQKVEVVSEDIPAAAPIAEEETQEQEIIDNTPATQQVAKYLTQERLHHRRVKSEKYKKLLEGNI
jgi:hypothetical protein